MLINGKALLIGGLLPTVLLGIGTVLMKLSMREGSSVANYLVHVGGAVLLVGLIATLTGSGWISTPRAGLFAFAMGVAWSAAIGAMAYAVSALDIPVSILSPLTNSNAVVALVASALVFNEWDQLSVPRVLTNKARADQYSAVLSGYSAVVQAKGEVARTKLENQRQTIMAFQIKTQAVVANAQVQNEYYRSVSLVGIENARLRMTTQIQGAESTRAFGQSIAQLGIASAGVYQHLASAAMSGMNTLAAETNAT